MTPAWTLAWCIGRGVTSHVGLAASGHTTARWRQDTLPPMTSGHHPMTSRDTHTPPQTTPTTATPNGHTPHRHNFSPWFPTSPGQWTSQTHHPLTPPEPVIPITAWWCQEAQTPPSHYHPQWPHTPRTQPEPAIPDTPDGQRTSHTHTPTDTARAHNP